MSKKIISVLLLVPLLFLTGCGKSKPADNNQPVNENANVAVNQNSAVNQEVKRFYPDQSPAVKPAGAAAETSFTVTQELVLKLYLIDKYNPGVCYGKPGSISNADIAAALSVNADLAKMLKSKYNLQTDSDVYAKVKQVNGIQLTPIAGGKYQFNFVDGDCCVLTAYEGEISQIGQVITETITNQETHQNPC